MKKSLRKICTYAVCAALLTGVVSGCGDKAIDYDLNGETTERSTSSGNGILAEKYGIPEECDTKLDVGNSGLEKIEIYDTNVTYPGASSMDIAYYTTNDLTDEKKQEITESVFDKDAGIYVYDWESMPKDEIQEQIERYDRLIQACIDNGETAEADMYKSEMSFYEEMLDGAADEYPAVEDYSEEEYIGTMDDREYELLFSDIYMCMEMHEDIYTYKNAENIDGATSCNFQYESYQLEVDADDLTNLCEIDENEAQLIAEDFISKLGIDDMLLVKTSGLYWEYNDDSSAETVAVELNGYTFTYASAINNVPILTKSVWSVDNLMENGVSVDIPTEEMMICVDANGIVIARWTDYMQATGEMENNVDLLTFDEMLEAANENVAAYYDAYPTGYSSVEFNDVELTYFLEETDEDGVFKYVPAWVLTEYEENADYSLEDDPTQMVVIDATNGEVIDLVSLSKALGTYCTYGD